MPHFPSTLRPRSYVISPWGLFHDAKPPLFHLQGPIKMSSRAYRRPQPPSGRRPRNRRVGPQSVNELTNIFNHARLDDEKLNKLALGSDLGPLEVALLVDPAEADPKRNPHRKMDRRAQRGVGPDIPTVGRAAPYNIDRPDKARAARARSKASDEGPSVRSI